MVLFGDPKKHTQQRSRVVAAAPPTNKSHFRVGGAATVGVAASDSAAIAARRLQRKRNAAAKVATPMRSAAGALGPPNLASPSLASRTFSLTPATAKVLRERRKLGATATHAGKTVRSAANASNVSPIRSAIKKSSLSRKFTSSSAASSKRKVKFSTKVHTYPTTSTAKKSARIGELKLKKRVKKLKRYTTAATARYEGGSTAVSHLSVASPAAGSFVPLNAEHTVGPIVRTTQPVLVKQRKGIVSSAAAKLKNSFKRKAKATSRVTSEQPANPARSSGGTTFNPETVGPIRSTVKTKPRVPRTSSPRARVRARQTNNVNNYCFDPVVSAAPPTVLNLKTRPFSLRHNGRQ